MPYEPAQHRLFEGIAHGTIRPRKGLSKEKAATMASEGVKPGRAKAKHIRSKK